MREGTNSNLKTVVLFTKDMWQARSYQGKGKMKFENELR